jgi:hypothetical protein
MSKLPFTKAHIAQLNGFIELCRNDPKILLHPELAFFKNYIESLGGKVPATVSGTGFESPKTDKPEPKKEKEPEYQPEPETESEESDIELDNSGIIGKCIYCIDFHLWSFLGGSHESDTKKSCGFTFYIHSALLIYF